MTMKHVGVKLSVLVLALLAFPKVTSLAVIRVGARPLPLAIQQAESVDCCSTAESSFLFNEINTIGIV
jgi:hypothetical protein